MTNPYVSYYLDQQKGYGMPVFRGSPWQMGHGQMGYGLGGLFRSLGRAVIPMIKKGAKALGNIALGSGKDLVGDVLSGKNIKQAMKQRGREAMIIAAGKALKRLQSGGGKGSRRSKRRRSTKISKSTKRPKSAKRPRGTKRSKSTKRSKRTKTVKKRKASRSAVRSRQTKKRRTAHDIFG